MSSTVFCVQQNKDFCEAFADNGFKISYVCNCQTFVFIGHHYWQLIGPKDTLSLHSNRSKVIDNWFGDEYKTAIEAEAHKWLTRVLKVS